MEIFYLITVKKKCFHTKERKKNPIQLSKVQNMFFFTFCALKASYLGILCGGYFKWDDGVNMGHYSKENL